ncbi:MAG: DeoR/GlpR family DNA-binding transcription regulator [Hyphomicrobiaceae bacterium]|nr:DeoR/GlpR family DNA-binding transcription regulator [Hyphomicrobiaceae bacterium]
MPWTNGVATLARKANSIGKLDRQQAILAEVRAAPAVRISTLAERFAVSTETIRRDLDEMSERGLLSRTYGGAAIPPLAPEPSLDDRYRTMADQRLLVAKAVGTLVQPGDTLMIDAGSTTIYVARQLAAELRGLTVVTTSFGVASSLVANPTIRILVCPGEFDPRDGGVCGPDTLAYLRRFHVTKAIIGASRLDADGPSDVISTSAWIKRVMIERAEQVILAVDGTKFEQRAFENVCGLDSLDYLATDAAPPPALARALAEAGVGVRVGEP